MAQQSIEQLEQDIEITLALLHADLNRKQWNFYIGQYHALCIRYLNMTGEPIITTPGKNDYIIGL